jgi:DNA-binding NtrC family response regulator
VARLAHLLIVDDDPDIADTVGEILRLAGHECRVAHDGRSALDEVFTRPPDLALLDVEMPVLTGPELALTLFLRNCGYEKIPVILASGVVGLREVASAVGTPYFLPKPYSIDELMRMVRRALEEHIAPHPPKESCA